MSELDLADLTGAASGMGFDATVEASIDAGVDAASAAAFDASLNASIDARPDPIADHLHALVADTDLPLSQQTPWQRYEMASFGDNRPTAIARAAAEKAARHALQKQLSEQIAGSRAQACEAGRAEGHAEGYAAGHAEGLAQGRIAALAEREQLQALLSGFSAELANANELVAQDVLGLALDLAKAMLKSALVIRPALVLPVVEEALRYLPVAQAPLQLQLHPDDATLVQTALGTGLAADGWRVRANSGIARGGCRIETGSNEIDAEIGTRWQRLAAALGKKSDWLDE